MGEDGEDFHNFEREVLIIYFWAYGFMGNFGES